jgi:DNA gyrase subunit A
MLRFAVNEEQLPIMGRTAMGLQAFRLLRNQQMVGCVTVGKDDQLLLVTQEGYAKRMAASQLRAANRGDLGTQALKFASKTDNLAGMVKAMPSLRDATRTAASYATLVSTWTELITQIYNKIYPENKVLY